MAYSSSEKKKLASSAQALNTNGEKTTSTNSSGDYLGATMELASTKPKGADDKSWATINSVFDASSKVNNADKKTDDAYSNLESIVNTKDIISKDVRDALNTKFVVPDAVTEADTWLAGQLEKIQSGKTSYSDQVREMMDKIINREKFSYDVDTDPLFQQALASAMNSGKQAMQDTIGQASALTGGYGSTYATTAGNQAYNSFIEDAYDNLPQYYQMAMEAYQMEGDEMYRQYSMYSTEDEKEYNRNVAAYDATYQYRNQVYNEAYGQYRDNKSDAFGIANLQLNEHGQRVNDAYNLYNATSNQADKLYQREYNSWLDSINNAWKSIELGNNDYWNESNQNFQATESQKNRDWQSAEAEKERAFTASENAKNRAASRSNSSGGSGLKTPTQTQKQKALEAYNKGGEEEYYKYLDSLPSNIDVAEIDYYVSGDGEGNGGYGVLPYSQRTYTVTNDGGTNWGWGIDNNAKVKDQYGNEYTLKQLAEYDKDLAEELSNKKYKVGMSYTKK